MRRERDYRDPCFRLFLATAPPADGGEFAAGDAPMPQMTPRHRVVVGTIVDCNQNIFLTEELSPPRPYVVNPIVARVKTLPRKESSDYRARCNRRNVPHCRNGQTNCIEEAHAKPCNQSNGLIGLRRVSFKGLWRPSMLGGPAGPRRKCWRGPELAQIEFLVADR